MPEDSDERACNESKRKGSVMGRILLEHDVQTKQTTYLHRDPDGGYVQEIVQDAEEIIKYNAEKGKRLNRKGNWWFVGSIPLTLCQRWATESGTRVFTRAWQEYAKKQVQLPEYRMLNPNKLRI